MKGILRLQMEIDIMQLKGTIVRQVWQGWYELVDISTGEVLQRKWTRGEIDGSLFTVTPSKG